MSCPWCAEVNVQDSEKDCYWIMPDGKKAVQILQVPAIACPSCGIFVTEATSQGIDDRLYWNDVSALGSAFTYEELLKAPRLKNWFLK